MAFALLGTAPPKPTKKIPVTGGGTKGGTVSGPGAKAVTIDKSVVPYIEAQPLTVQAYNLKPGAQANVWIDNTQVNQFVQPCSLLTPNAGFSPNGFVLNEGIYCNSTHAYAQVVEYNQSAVTNQLHINENFVTLNVLPYGPANSNSFFANSFTVNEIVYQASGTTANIYANTWVARVVYWAPNDSALTVQTITGTPSVNTGNGTVIIFRSADTHLANANGIVQGNKFPTGQQVISTSNSSNKFLANGYFHTMGEVSVLTSNTSKVQLSGNVFANQVNSIIQFVSGFGNGQNTKIISISGTSNNIVNVSPAITGYSGNTFYAIGNNFVNSVGLCPFVMWIPEDGGANFPAGNRLVTVNDGRAANDSAATMRATGTFAVSGSIAGSSVTTPVVQQTHQHAPSTNNTIAPSHPTSAQQTGGPINDAQSSTQPLCQTFFTPKSGDTNNVDNGIFVTSIDLWFQQKPTDGSAKFPVSVYVVETVNGFPTKTILGTATVRYEGVAVTDGISTFPSVGVGNTHFIFDDPVYCAPGQEYGLVVYSENPNYFIWLATLGLPLINSTRLVSPSPYIGALFKSMNATAWTPIQNQSLMFSINKAVFNTSPSLLNFNVIPLLDFVGMDTVLLTSSDLSFSTTNVGYSVQAIYGDTGQYDVGFSVSQGAPFSYGGDQSTSNQGNTRRRVVPPGNTNGAVVTVTLTTNDANVSPMFHSERLAFTAIQNQIDAGGIQNSQITITNPGNHINANNIVVTIGPPTGEAGLSVNATANVFPNGLSGNSLVALHITNPGGGYVQTPTITITEAGAPSNATAVFNGEDNLSGGNGWTRYVTRPITLADGFDAGDLQVILNAVRPQGTDIAVYYKVLGTADNSAIQDRSWVLMTKISDNFSADQKTPVQIRYNTGFNSLGVPRGTVTYTYQGTQYPLGGTFKQFAIKIVLYANDPTVPPVVNSFTGIAVPAG